MYLCKNRGIPRCSLDEISEHSDLDPSPSIGTEPVALGHWAEHARGQCTHYNEGSLSVQVLPWTILEQGLRQGSREARETWQREGQREEKAGNGEGKGKAGNGKSGKESFSSHRQKILTLCRKHNRMGYGDTNITLLLQLGCGFFTYQEWAHVIPKLHDEISGDGGSVAGHTYQGSHLCHNGRSNVAFCSNIFCIIWESTVDSRSRKICYNNFLDGSDRCVCAPASRHLVPLRQLHTADS
jgi:hypothetical protein